MITGSNLTKSYNGFKALDDINISCSAGEICGLLGANGAGKTTLFKILLGLITPNSGSFKINSKRVKPIGGIIEKPALYEYLNSYQNLKVFSKIQGAPYDRNSIIESLEKVGLPLNRKDPVRNFSMGMKQRLGIAIALLNNPECLILDEPFSGLDPVGISSLRTLIQKLAEEKKLAIIISSHIIEELSKICHTLHVIAKGKIIKAGPAHLLIQKNTNAFTICAPDIQNSVELKGFQSDIKGNCARVIISAEEVPQLIQKLAEERIYITSCTPEIDMHRLFQNPTL